MKNWLGNIRGACKSLDQRGHATFTATDIAHVFRDNAVPPLSRPGGRSSLHRALNRLIAEGEVDRVARGRYKWSGE